MSLAYPLSYRLPIIAMPSPFGSCGCVLIEVCQCYGVLVSATITAIETPETGVEVKLST